jgi:hypothetical protein
MIWDLNLGIHSPDIASQWRAREVSAVEGDAARCNFGRKDASPADGLQAECETLRQRPVSQPASRSS